MPVIQTRQPGGASEAKQDAIIAALDSVGLDAATLAALETVTATISNFPADYPDAAAGVLLTAIKNAVEGTLDVNVVSSLATSVSGTVGLDSATLAALETINAVVSGEVELGITTLTALESVTATVSNFPSVYPDGHLQPLTKTQLDSSTVAVSGSVSVSNFPASTEISNDSGNPIPVTGTQLDALTDAEIRASALDVADSGEREYTHVTADVASSGDTTIYTPAAGNSIRLRWIFITPSLESDPFPKITVKLGTDELYKFYGSMAKRQLKTGTIDSALIINLSVSGNVAVTAILEEI